MSLPLILHVEDDDQDRRMLARIHRRYAPPSVLLQVPSAERAREVMAGEATPVLLLVDLRLPGEAGREFVRWARYSTQNEKVPIVAITGIENVDAAFDAVAAGADQILLKSLANQPFEERVREIFATHLVARQV